MEVRGSRRGCEDVHRSWHHATLEHPLAAAPCSAGRRSPPPAHYIHMHHVYRKRPLDTAGKATFPVSRRCAVCHSTYPRHRAQRRTTGTTGSWPGSLGSHSSTPLCVLWVELEALAAGEVLDSIFPCKRWYRLEWILRATQCINRLFIVAHAGSSVSPAFSWHRGPSPATRHLATGSHNAVILGHMGPSIVLYSGCIATSRL
jgi:hypothetical protein